MYLKVIKVHNPQPPWQPGVYKKRIQKFLDSPPGLRTSTSTTATRCHNITIFWVSVVSSATTTLCVASQRMFCLLLCALSVIRDLLMADFKEQCTCSKICFTLGITALEMHEVLKTAFCDNGVGRTQTFLWPCRLKLGESIKWFPQCVLSVHIVLWIFSIQKWMFI
jgi:hypothetical protein